MKVLPEHSTATLPRWKCHKEVHAFKIREIKSTAVGDTKSDGSAFLVSADDGGTIRVTAEFMRKHRPQIGGYYVRYEDGYESFSPANAFEDGYTRIA